MWNCNQCRPGSVIGDELQGQCTGAIPPSRPGKSWSSGTKNCYDGGLPGCSGWPGTSLGATSCSRRSNDTCCHRLHKPLAPPVNSSACSAGSQASHALELTLPNSNSPRVWDPSVTLTWFSKLAKAHGVAAVTCDSYGEPQVRAECHGRFSGRRAVLKGHWRAPLTKGTHHSLNTPYTWHTIIYIIYEWKINIWK